MYTFFQGRRWQGTIPPQSVDPKEQKHPALFWGGGGRDKGRRERGLTSLGSGAELNTLTSEVRL